uniref:Uncharacterized protein n=1 Tax=Oryza nivara TaxID=4536 RepID=A0A0E0G1L1_ORYNI
MSEINEAEFMGPTTRPLGLCEVSGPTAQAVEAAAQLGEAVAEEIFSWCAITVLPLQWEKFERNMPATTILHRKQREVKPLNPSTPKTHGRRRSSEAEPNARSLALLRTS